MAVLPDAVEIWDYVPADPSNAVVLADRYIICVHQTADEFMVFDAALETSAAFDGVGTVTLGRNIVAYGGYAWTFGMIAGDGHLIRIGSNGGVATKNVGSKSVARAIVAADGGNIWHKEIATIGAVFRGFGFLDPGTFIHTALSDPYPTNSGLWFTAGGGTVVCGDARFNSATGAALPSGTAITNNTTTANPVLDGNNSWSMSTTNFKTVDQTDDTTVLTPSLLSGNHNNRIPTYGPNNLMYMPEANSPNTGLAVIDRTNRLVARWDFPIARTTRTTVAYAQGKMWAFSRETP